MTPHTVTAAAYPPAARRTRWHAIVAACPYCQGAHVHHGTAEDPVEGLVLAGCRRGHYDVTPHEASPAAAQ